MLNVLTVGLLAIAAYLVLMVWWLRYEERREEGEPEPEPDADGRRSGEVGR